MCSDSGKLAEFWTSKQHQNQELEKNKSKNHSRFSRRAVNVRGSSSPPGVTVGRGETRSHTDRIPAEEAQVQRYLQWWRGQIRQLGPPGNFCLSKERIFALRWARVGKKRRRRKKKNLVYLWILLNSYYSILCEKSAGLYGECRKRDCKHKKRR